MAGGPSQLDLFDPKPKLHDARRPADPGVDHQGRAVRLHRPAPSPDAPRLAVRRSSSHGRAGARSSSLLPHLARVADDIAIVRSLHTDQFNHAPGQIFMNTGTPLVRPAEHGLVADLRPRQRERTTCPAFVVLLSGRADPRRPGTTCWGSGFLPTTYQGVQFRSAATRSCSSRTRRASTAGRAARSLDAVDELNQRRLADVGDPEIATRIAAVRDGVPHADERAGADRTSSREPPATLDACTARRRGKASFANNCLLARRLVERGVRFVQLYHRGLGPPRRRDHDITTAFRSSASETDQAGRRPGQGPEAARAARQTRWSIWGGEFGRTPDERGRREGPTFLGRDHHPRAFTMWMAGGGDQAGGTLVARPTSSATTSPRTRCTSTTCTRRSCT